MILSFYMYHLKELRINNHFTNIVSRIFFHFIDIISRLDINLPTCHTSPMCFKYLEIFAELKLQRAKKNY